MIFGKFKISADICKISHRRSANFALNSMSVYKIDLLCATLPKKLVAEWRRYTNVLPSEPAAAHADAGIVHRDG